MGLERLTRKGQVLQTRDRTRNRRIAVNQGETSRGNCLSRDSQLASTSKLNNSCAREDDLQSVYTDTYTIRKFAVNSKLGQAKRSFSRRTNWFSDQLHFRTLTFPGFIVQYREDSVDVFFVLFSLLVILATILKQD